MVKRSPAKDGRAAVVVVFKDKEAWLEKRDPQPVGVCTSRSYPYEAKNGQSNIKNEHEIVQKMLEYPEGTVFARISRTEWANLQESRQYKGL